MIAVPAGVKVLVATKPVDFRKGGDGLIALVPGDARAGSILWNDFCVPCQASGPCKNCGLGWVWTDPFLEAAGTRRIQVAPGHRRRDAVEVGAIGGACRRDGLVASAPREVARPTATS